MDKKSYSPSERACIRAHVRAILRKLSALQEANGEKGEPKGLAEKIVQVDRKQDGF